MSLAYSSSRNRVTEIVGVLGPTPSSFEQYYHVTGKSLEATFTAQLLHNANGVLWDVALVGDRRRSKLTDYPRACFTGGFNRYCAGATLGTMWGARLVQNRNELPSLHENSSTSFDINDEGYVVPVGTGNTWRDGKTKNLWGTSVVVDGRTYPWGLPIVQRSSDGLIAEHKIGDANPAFSWMPLREATLSQGVSRNALP